MNKRDVLEKLAFDPKKHHVWARLDFAENGKYLSILKDDSAETVRMAVAKHGVHLDQLIQDPSINVRDIARQQLDLKIHRRSMRFGK